MSLVFNVDIVDNSVVNTIIYSNNNSNEEVRGCALVPSASNSRSILVSSSNKSKEEYTTKVQRESDNINQDDPVTMSDSIQLEYATPMDKLLVATRWLTHP